MSTATVLDTVGTTLSVAGVLTGGWLGFGIIMAGEYLSSKAEQRRLDRLEEDEVSKQTYGSPEASLPVVYGRAEVGGRIVDIRKLPRAFVFRPKDAEERITEQLAVVVAWCVGSEDGSGIEAIEKTFVNDGLVSIDGSTDNVRQSGTFFGPPAQEFEDDVNEFFLYLNYSENLGTDTQQTWYTPSEIVPPVPLANEPGTDIDDVNSWNDIWGEESRLRGVAYSVFVFYWDDEVYGSGLPTDFKAVIKGNKVYDPRTDSVEWSDNPALCTVDYLTSRRYGAGVDYNEINESLLIANANLQDEIVGDYTRPDVEGTIDIKRGVVGGALDTGNTLEANIESIAATGRISTVYTGGKFNLITRTIDTPVDFEINESNIVGDIQFTRSGVRDVPTSVSVKFSDQYNRWNPTQVEFPPGNIDNPFVDITNGLENNLHVDLRMCPDEGTAFDIAQVLFAEAQLDQGVTVTCNESALQLSVGDIVPVSHETMGWNQKLFRVFGMGISPMGEVQVILRDYDETAYDLDPTTTVPRNPGSDLPDPFDVEPPIDFALLSDENTALETQDGQYLPRILATWLDDSSIFLSGVELEYAEYDDEDSDPEFDPEDWEWQELPFVPTGRQQKLIGPVTDKQEYIVRIRSRTRIGAVSDWVYETVEASTQPGAESIAPQIVADISYDVDGNGDDIAIVVAEVFDPYQRQIATDPVLFYLRQGPVGDIPAPATPDWDVATIETSGPNEGKYVWQVPLSEKHFSFLGIAVRWGDFSQNQFIAQKNLYLDIGDDANIVFVTIHYTGDGNRAFVKVKGDADTQELRVQEFRNGTWGNVFNPQSSITDGTRFSTARRGQFEVLTEDDARLFRVFGRNAQGDDGPFEEVSVSSRLDLDTDIGPDIILKQLIYDVDGQGFNIARAVVDIDDPDELTDEVLVYSEQGPVQGVPVFSSYSVWERETSGPFDGFFVEEVRLSEKHLGLIAVAVRWIDADERNRITQKILWLDIDEIANIVFVEVAYSENGSVALIQVKGDADTAALEAQEFRGGNWGAVFEPLEPFIDGDKFSGNRRGSFSVNTEEDRRRFRVRGINPNDEPGPYDEFEINDKFDDPTDPPPPVINIIEARWTRGVDSSSREERQILLDLSFRSDVRSLRISYDPAVFDPEGVSGAFEFNFDASVDSTLAGYVVSDSSGTTQQFSVDATAAVQITIQAYSEEDQTSLISQRTTVLSQDLAPQVFVAEGASLPVASEFLEVGSGLSVNVVGKAAVLQTTAAAVSTANGITGDGSAGDPVSLTGRALQLHNVATTGLYTRVDGNTVVTSEIVGGSGIDVTNGDGVGGSPSIAVDDSVMRRSGENIITGVVSMDARLSMAGTTTSAITGSFHRGSTIPTATIVTLNWNGEFRATRLFEGSTRVATVDNLDGLVPETRQVNAGDGLAGGGDLFQDRTLSLVGPGDVTADTASQVTANGHTHKLADNIGRVFVQSTAPPQGVTPDRAGDIWVVV